MLSRSMLKEANTKEKFNFEELKKQTIFHIKHTGQKYKYEKDNIHNSRAYQIIMTKAYKQFGFICNEL